MPWAILIPLLLKLVEWLLSKDGPFSKRDAKNMVEFVKLSRRAERRARKRGLEIPDEVEDDDEAETVDV